MPNRRLFFFLFVVVFLVVIALLWKQPKVEPIKQANNFKECAAAGYPIMESYPRQCRTRGGRFFLKKIIESRKNNGPGFLFRAPEQLLGVARGLGAGAGAARQPQ